MIDSNGKDCCDKVKELGLYKNIELFWNDECIKNPTLRKNMSMMSKPQLYLSPKPKKEEQMVDTQPLSDRHKLNDHLNGVDVIEDMEKKNKVGLKLKLDIRKANEVNE